MSRILLALIASAASIYFAYSAICIGTSRTILRYRREPRNLEFALRLTPKDPLIKEYLAQIYLFDPDRIDLPLAKKLVLSAIEEDPKEFRLWIIRARIEERSGDLNASEDSLKKAIELAPNYFEANWELANLRLRKDDLEGAEKTFKSVLTVNPDQLPNTLDLIWQVTESREALESVLPDNPSARCEMIRFLSKKGELKESYQQLIPILKSRRSECNEVAEELLNKLIDAKEYNLAWEVWTALPDKIDKNPAKNQVQNGNFLIPISKKSIGFDWSYTDFPEVKLQRDKGQDDKSYSLHFLYNGSGRESFDHLRQIILVEPNKRYLLSFKVQTSNLVTVSPPKIDIIDLTGTEKSPLLSATIPAGTYDWRSFELPFKSGPNTQAVLLSIKREATCKEDELCPIFGSLWLSDLALKEENGH